jgi:UDP-N-acetylmuramoyl-tripeptide--D-alanyl-D-alanine ligase
VIPLTLDEVGRLCAGELRTAAWADRITGVQIDSRRIDEGDLFVAVANGVAYVKHAFARGAAATLVPDNAFGALGALGRTVRERSSARIAGITGSTGKTSTKDMVAALVRPHARVVAAEASYNAELGVPLTLCRLEPDTEICVLELAMRGFGQIEYLAAIARPHVGVITNIAPVHLEFVGSRAGVAKAKAELIEALPAGGTAVVPAGEPELDPYLGRDDIRQIRFGPGGDVELESFEPGARAWVRAFGDRRGLPVPFAAGYQAMNLVAAVAVYAALGLPFDRVAAGSRDIELSRWRGEECPLPGGGLLINDAYNANPTSMRAALTHQLARADGRRRIAVLGEMRELGPEEHEYHAEIGEYARKLGVKVLIGVGGIAARFYLAPSRGVIQRYVGDAKRAIAELQDVYEPGDCVLIKGSRAVGLEAVAEAFTTKSAA